MAIKASQRALITVVWYANEDEGIGGMPSKTKEREKEVITWFKLMTYI